MKCGADGAKKDCVMEDRGQAWAVSLDQAAQRLSVCRRTLERLIAGGQLRVVKLRGCTRVPMDEVKRLLGAERERGS